MNALLCLALVVAAPALKEKPVDPAKLEGEWQGERFTDSGGPSWTRPAFTRYRFEPTGAWRLFDDGKPPHQYEGRFEVNKGDEPCSANLTMHGREWLAIYRIEGDTLTVAMRSGAKGRPDRFESPKDSQIFLKVFKRVKK